MKSVVHLFLTLCLLFVLSRAAAIVLEQNTVMNGAVTGLEYKTFNVPPMSSEYHDLVVVESCVGMVRIYVVNCTWWEERNETCPDATPEVFNFIIVNTDPFALTQPAIFPCSDQAETSLCANTGWSFAIQSMSDPETQVLFQIQWRTDDGTGSYLPVFYLDPQIYVGVKGSRMMLSWGSMMVCDASLGIPCWNQTLTTVMDPRWNVYLMTGVYNASSSDINLGTSCGLQLLNSDMVMTLGFSAYEFDWKTNQTIQHAAVVGDSPFGQFCYTPAYLPAYEPKQHKHHPLGGGAIFGIVIASLCLCGVLVGLTVALVFTSTGLNLLSPGPRGSEGSPLLRDAAPAHQSQM